MSLVSPKKPDKADSIIYLVTVFSKTYRSLIIFK